MATVKITLDKRTSNKTKNKKCPLVLRLSHKRKTRDISLNLHLKENQFDEETKKISGILNAVRHTKRTLKIYSDVDLWMDEHIGEIQHWEISKLKDEIEQQFFKKQASRTILNHGAVYLARLQSENRYSTASSYEDALKALVKYRKSLKNHDDTILIKTLFVKEGNNLSLIEEYEAYDLQIKAMDYSFLTGFKAYMSKRFSSVNTPNIHLRSLQAIMNDAGKTHPELRDHKPLSEIKKQSIENIPMPLNQGDIAKVRALKLEEGSPLWHTRNYFLFMFNNMGMNHFDMAILKRFQYVDGRIKYFRKKTHYEGDYFSVLQNEESQQIISHYLKGQKKDEYLFPIIPNGTSQERLFKVNNGKVKSFNKYAKRLAALAGVEKRITSYTPRDTWTNIGLDMGIDIRKISSGLGHSSVQVTEKHYGKSVSEKILDEINNQITQEQKV